MRVNTSVTDYAIHVKGIARHFADVKAVDGIDIDIPKGEIYGFLGPNGAGKTTLVRMLITLLLPTAGQASIAGFDLITESDQIRLRIGAALQDVALDPKQKGIELLRLQGYLYGLSKSEVRRRISELDSLLDMGEAINRSIDTYSGGMKRRLDLAAALIHNPEVLFLDEPTTGLDPISRSRVWQQLRDINQNLGVTIFLTTQYLEEADFLANRVGIINQGKLVAEGTPTELKRAIGSDLIIAEVEGDPGIALEAVRKIRDVGGVESHDNELIIRVSNGAAQIGDVAIALYECGVGIKEITMRTPTLDDVFLDVTGGRLEDASDAEEESE